MRTEKINEASATYNLSKQTVRNYLCLYLVYQNKAVFAPKQRAQDTELSQDEKNMRWALNKFFYTKNKNSLKTAYTFMLKNKYCDESGALISEYPSFYQFRYFYRKTRNMQNYYISRDGIKSYQRNKRPLLGDGVQSFASSVGKGMLDSTICDIYLVSDTGEVIGRPVLTAQIDLSNHIEAIAAAADKNVGNSIKNIRTTRKREISMAHIDYVRAGEIYG